MREREPKFAAFAVALILLWTAAGIARGTDTIILAPTPAAMGPTDSASWSALGGDGTHVPNPFNATSSGGSAIQGTFAASSGIVAAVGQGWGPASGSNALNDTLVWAFDNSANSGSGAVTFSFPAGFGAGATIQGDSPGKFTAKLELFNAGVSLGFVTMDSDAAGDAVFIGAQDLTGANVTGATFSLTAAPATDNSVNTAGDFALGTLILPTTNLPILSGSGALATPNPAGVGQTVAFLDGATGGFGALAYTWSFGDGSLGAPGATVSYNYLAAGTYTATVSVTDTVNRNASFTTQVTVNAPVVGTGMDSDGDGFSDAFETAAGSDPAIAASTPTGSAVSAGSIQKLVISKASIKLNFAKSGSDSISFSGTVAVPKGFISAGAKTFFLAGGIYKTLTLTSKGSVSSGADSLKLMLKSAKGVVAANPAAKFTATFKSGTFAAPLASAGLTSVNAKAVHVMVPFTFIFNNLVYQKTQMLGYTATRGKSGTAKSFASDGIVGGRCSQ